MYTKTIESNNMDYVNVIDRLTADTVRELRLSVPGIESTEAYIQIQDKIQNLLEYIQLTEYLSELYTVLKIPVVHIRNQQTANPYAVQIPALAAYLTFNNCGEDLDINNVTVLHAGSVSSTVRTQETLQLIFNQPELEIDYAERPATRFMVREIISVRTDLLKAQTLAELNKYEGISSVVTRKENAYPGEYKWGESSIPINIQVDRQTTERPYTIHFSWEEDQYGKWTITDLVLVKKQNKDTRKGVIPNITFGGNNSRATAKLFSEASCRDQDIPRVYWDRVIQKLDLLNLISGNPAGFYQLQDNKQLGNNVEQFKVSGKGVCAGQWSIRINEQYRLIFDWDQTTGNITNVEFIDYH